MKFLEAVKKCDFENGEYLVERDGSSSIRLHTDGLRFYFCDENITSDCSLYDLDIEWEIKAKYLTLDEVLAEAKKGKKIARKDWSSKGDFITYIPAINCYLFRFSNTNAILAEEIVKNELMHNNWYVVSEQSNDQS